MALNDGRQLSAKHESTWSMCVKRVSQPNQSDCCSRLRAVGMEKGWPACMAGVRVKTLSDEELQLVRPSKIDLLLRSPPPSISARWLAKVLTVNKALTTCKLTEMSCISPGRYRAWTAFQ